MTRFAHLKYHKGTKEGQKDEDSGLKLRRLGTVNQHPHMRGRVEKMSHEDLDKFYSGLRSKAIKNKK